MNNRIERIKSHIKENKKFYVSGGICLSIGVATGFILSKGQVTIVDAFKLQVNSPTTNNVTTLLERRGHPGYLIKCKETGEVFASQNRAAQLLNLNASRLSEHLNGTTNHVNGLTFERLGEAI